MKSLTSIRKEYKYAAVIAAGVLVVGLILYAGQHKRPTTAPVSVAPLAAVMAPVAANPQQPMLHYIDIENACDWEFVGQCVNVRSGPGTNYPSVLRLRDGMVFQVAATTTEADGQEWYKVVFDKDVRYPERITSDWYVAAVPGSVTEFDDPGEQDLQPGTPPVTDKRIVVDLTAETLTAYQGTTVFMTETISRGVASNPTSVGTFSIYKKTPSRYMQGPLPGETDEYYDLPGTPWDLYFTQDGAVLHGAYWHNSFGTPMSHGCINQPPANAKKLYYWADLGTPVIVNP